MALIVGLGNPGAQYAGTRHNIGFEVVEELARRNGLKWGAAKHQSLLAVGTVAGVPVALAKPTTFMNLSGRAVTALVRHYGLKPDQILVVADDLDLETGRVRMRAKGSPGGHNGHKSIVQALGTQEYARIKIGIGRGDDETIDHVLSKFRPDERETVRSAVEKAADGCEDFLREGIERAMNRTNPA
ncbi:MAG: aminoacyl-tRNA hydrolase [Fimbriimonadaceae bacterium]|nr:aminoacyl-tRNA hydrolase [Fimbriimonadaceae bacterium]QYK56961.1 MAG: aminoacyl-tRNA hydrolase [Fimbriimonadaceae bacterium]